MTRPRDRRIRPQALARVRDVDLRQAREAYRRARAALDTATALLEESQALLERARRENERELQPSPPPERGDDLMRWDAYRRRRAAAAAELEERVRRAGQRRGDAQAELDRALDLLAQARRSADDARARVDAERRAEARAADARRDEDAAEALSTASGRPAAGPRRRGKGGPPEHG
jgi:DNA repair exonuclease SbcCD ATPase subunit